MEISDKTTDEYIEIYREDFDEVLSRDEAREILTRLFSLCELMLQHPPQNNRKEGEGI